MMRRGKGRGEERERREDLITFQDGSYSLECVLFEPHVQRFSIRTRVDAVRPDFELQKGQIETLTAFTMTATFL